MVLTKTGGESTIQTLVERVELSSGKIHYHSKSLCPHRHLVKNPPQQELDYQDPYANKNAQVTNVSRWFINSITKDAKAANQQRSGQNRMPRYGTNEYVANARAVEATLRARGEDITSQGFATGFTRSIDSLKSVSPGAIVEPR